VHFAVIVEHLRHPDLLAQNSVNWHRLFSPSSCVPSRTALPDCFAEP
jgi:arylsulfatase A-like enzyme